MAAQHGPVRLQSTQAEKNSAHLNDNVEHGTQTDPVIKTDALATSSIIYSALQQINNDAGIPQEEVAIINNMKEAARKLSRNSLASWYKGAVLLTGNAAQITEVYGASFSIANCYAPDGSMRPWLTELRRAYGNDWEGCMQAARMIEDYQAAKMRDEQWARLPAVSTFERTGGNVRGWESINTTSDHVIGINANYLDAHGNINPAY